MTRKQESLKINFIMNAILTMSSFIFPLITFPYVSRILLPDGIGKVSFATSVINYFVMIARLGIPIYGVRACAKVRDNKKELTKTVQEIFIINLLMCIMTYILFLIALFKIARLYEDRTILVVISFTMFFDTIGMEWLYKALEQYTYITVRSIIFKFIALIAMFILIHEQKDYIIYGGISIFAASASNIFNLVNINKYIGMKPVGKYNFKPHFKPIAVFFAMSCATTIYTNLDTVMLGFMKTNEDVGLYYAAARVKSILISIVTSLGVVVLPRATYYIEHGFEKEFYRITQKAINFVVLLAAPMMLYFILFASEGIFVLSGSAYTESIVPMQIMMPTLLFIGLTNIMGIQMLIPMGKENKVLYSVAAGAVVDLVLNIILIPKMASVGAAIGTLVAECVVWIVQYMILRDIVAEAYKRIRYIPLGIALILSSIVSIWVKTIGLGNFNTLLLSAILFFAIYILVLTIAKEPLVLEIKKQVFAKVLKNIDRNRGI